MKAGIKTTEFWLTIAASVVSILVGLNLEGTAGSIIGVAAVVLTTLGYTVSRTSAKKSAASEAAAHSTENTSKPEPASPV